jgi:hypothetical protein
VLARRAALVILATVLVHHGVYSIPFEYSEIPGIQRNPVVQRLDVFSRRMLTPRGLLQRPVSVLSYAFDHAAWGDDVRGFHATNVVVHCVNAVLTMSLAGRLAAPPLLAGLLFAVHPLSTAAVSQIFGRNYSLATTFMLLGLLLHLRWRRGGLDGPRLAVLGAVFLLAVLTKQSLVVFPLLLAWYEVGDGLTLLDSSWTALVATVGVLAVGAALLFGYAVPLSRTAPVGPLTFLLSQLGNAPVIAGFYLLPYRTALVHDLPFYADPWHGEIWVGAALVGAVLVLAWRWRARPAGFLLGAMVLCLLPTNSVLPKNEVVREWRLYPTLPFFALLASAALARAGDRLRGRPGLRVALGVVTAAWLVAFAATDVRQDRVYQSAVDTWRQVLARYPDSADAMNNLGTHYLFAGDARAATRYLTAATKTAPRVFLYHDNLAKAWQAAGRADLATREAQKAQRVWRRWGRHTMALRLR